MPLNLTPYKPQQPASNPLLEALLGLGAKKIAMGWEQAQKDKELEDARNAVNIGQDQVSNTLEPTTVERTVTGEVPPDGQYGEVIKPAARFAMNPNYAQKGATLTTINQMAAPAKDTLGAILTGQVKNKERTLEDAYDLTRRPQTQAIQTTTGIEIIDRGKAVRVGGNQVVTPVKTQGTPLAQIKPVTGLDENNAPRTRAMNIVTGETKADLAGQYTPEQRATGRSEASAKFRFRDIYDPELGREVPISNYELAKRMSRNNPPVTTADAKRVQPVLGAVPEVYYTLQNTRKAADEALASNNGQLNFNKTQLAEMSALLNKHKASLDSTALSGYLQALITSASDAPTRNYVNHLKTMYEALQPLRGLLGVKGAQSDTQYLALIGAAPGPTDVYAQDIHGKLDRLENSIALSTSSMPTVKGPHGYTIRDLNMDMQDRRNGLAFENSVLNKVLTNAEQRKATAPKVPRQVKTQREMDSGLAGPEDYDVPAQEERTRAPQSLGAMGIGPRPKRNPGESIAAYNARTGVR